MEEEIGRNGSECDNENHSFEDSTTHLARDTFRIPIHPKHEGDYGTKKTILIGKELTQYFYSTSNNTLSS